jgi:hypothetical protein
VPGERSTHAVFFRVTEQEYRDLQEVARDNRMRVAEAVRHATNEFVADYRERLVFNRKRRTDMRRLSMIGLLTLALAPTAWAQENNPCQVPLQTVTDPKAIYVASDEWGDPAKIARVRIKVIAGTNPEPIYEYVVAPTAFQMTGFFGCGRAAFEPDPAKLARDGKTVYGVLVQFENAAHGVSPWSGIAPFVLSAPVVVPPRAPTLRLGTTEE